jgi:endonuclease/exonuclease/phosphatase family metal-dependent hydrolase
VTTVDIISWNLLHSVGAGVDEVAELILKERPDLLLMQETTMAIDRLPAKIGGFYARDPLPGRLHGLAAWSPVSFRVPPAALVLQSGLIVRRVCQIIEFSDFAVANVHLSHGQVLNRRQLRRIAGILPPRAAILGDCNLVGPPLLPGFHDVGPRVPTHAAGALIPMRLDRCFVRGLAAAGARVMAKGGSDHHPIAITLRVPRNLSGGSDRVS